MNRAVCAPDLVIRFSDCLKALTGHTPMRWQERPFDAKCTRREAHAAACTRDSNTPTLQHSTRTVRQRRS